jgi:hypothetical protein
MMKDMTAVVAAAAAAVLLSSAVTTTTTAFVLPKSNGRVVIPYTGTEITRTALIASTLEQPPTTFSKNGTAPFGLLVGESHDAMGGSWECNDDAECKQVPECDDQGLSCKTSLDVRIHGDWYDLTGTYVDVTYLTYYVVKEREIKYSSSGVEWSGVERLFFLFFVLSFDRVEITTAPEEKTFAI